jgi:hypothetical protein
VEGKDPDYEPLRAWTVDMPNWVLWRREKPDEGDKYTIPVDVATTLMHAGTIMMEDIGSEQNYHLANGATVKGTQFRIHSLQVGEGDNAIISQDVDGTGDSDD